MNNFASVASPLS